MKKINSKSTATSGQGVSSFRIIAALAVAAPLIAGPIVRHLVPQAVILTASAIILGVPTFVVIAFVIYRKFSGPRTRISQSQTEPQPKKSLAWYAAQSERWRQSLAVLMIIVIGALCALLTVGGTILMAVSTSFMAFVMWLTPTIGLLVVLTVSIFLAFGGAASLGPRLIRLTTGRMPLGNGKTRA
ncbi:MAG: hypothetical protein ABI191_03360 [Rhizomicrobium sp.]